MSTRPSAGASSQWGCGGKSNARRSPSSRTTTLPSSPAPSGTSAAGRFGTVSMSARKRSSAPRRRSSVWAIRSPSARTCSRCCSASPPCLSTSPMAWEASLRWARSWSVSSTSARRSSSSRASSPTMASSSPRRRSAARKRSGSRRTNSTSIMAPPRCAPAGRGRHREWCAGPSAASRGGRCRCRGRPSAASRTRARG